MARGGNESRQPVGALVALGAVVLATAAVLLASCGGSGGGPRLQGFGGTTVDGTAAKGAIEFGQVELFELTAGGALGPQIGVQVSTGTTGTFAIVDLSTASSTGFCVLRVRGGNVACKYVDEQTGANVALTASDELLAVFRQTGIDRVAITPLTHMAAVRAMRLASLGTPLDVAVESSNAAIARLYGLSSILSVFPVNPTNQAKAQVAEREERLYGLILGALARMANAAPTPGYAARRRAIDLGYALADDASDGTLDGRRDGVAIAFPIPTGTPPPAPVTLSASAGLADLNSHLAAFQADAARNKTGIANHAIATIQCGSVGVASGTELRVATTAFPVWVSGQAGQGILVADGGTPPYTWTGAVDPFGLSVSGLVAGIGPGLAPGTTRALFGPYDLIVTDSAQPPASSCVTIYITVTQPPPTVTLGTIPPLEEGIPADFQLVTASGGTGQFFFTLETAGGFPPLGLILDPDGRLVGTPSVSGGFSFSVCAVDLTGAKTCQPVVLGVAPAPINPLFLGSFNGTSTSSRPPPPVACTWSDQFDGTITIDLATQPNGTVGGSARVVGTMISTATSPNCLDFSDGFDVTAPVSGTTGDIRFNVVLTPGVEEATFQGSLSGTTISGVMTATYIVGSGTATLPVTLVRQ